MSKFMDSIQLLKDVFMDEDSSRINHYLMDGVLDFIFLMEMRDGQFYYELINEAAKKGLDLDSSWDKKSMEEVLPRDMYERLMGYYTEVIETKDSIMYEDEFILNGKKCYGHSVVTPILNDEGECTHVLAVTRDITQRVVKEQEATQIKEIYESLLNNTADAFLIFSPQREVLETNPAFEQMYGWTQKELEGDGFPFVPLECKQESDELIQKVLNGQRISSLETTRVTKDGTLLDVSISMAPLHNAKREIVAISSIIRDISSQKQFEKNLEESRTRYASLFQYNPEPIFQLDLAGIIVKVNPAFESAVGRTKEQVKQTSLLQYIPENDFAHVLDYMNRFKDGKTTTFTSRVNCLEGERLFDITTSPIYLNGELHGVYGIMQDKTEKVQALSALSSSEEKYRIIADYSQDLITVHQPNGKTTYASPSHEHLLGEQVDCLLEGNLTEGVHPDDEDHLKKSFFQSLLTLETFTANVRRKNKQGEWDWYEAIGTPAVNEESQVSHVVIVARNISERIEYEERLKDIAFYDYLTDLPNKRLFEDRLKQVVAHTNRSDNSFALMYLDGDGFKEINDEYGHHIGDQYLKQVGCRLNEWVRDEDTVARIGGDEFAVILTDIESKENAFTIADRLRDSLNKEYEIEDVAFHSSFSIGISLFPQDTNEEEELLQYADQALYAAKEKGKDCISFFDQQQICL